MKNKPLKWWGLVAGRYPALSHVALKVFSIPATSAASERNWSAFGFIHSKLRNRLSNEQVEKIVYIYWNLRILREMKQSSLLIHESKKDAQNMDKGKEVDQSDMNMEFEIEEDEESILFDYVEEDFDNGELSSSL